MFFLANLLTSTKETINLAQQKQTTKKTLEMWANAQRDSRPAEHTVGGALCSTPQSLADDHY